VRSDAEIIWREFGMVPDVTIWPLADVHLGAEESDCAAFERLVEEIAAEPRCYVILAGDLIDNGIKNSVTNCYRQTMRPSDQRREMARILDKIRSKIIAFLPGNHERRNGKEVDNDPCYDIACKLDLEDIYREDMAIIRIGLGKRPTNGKEYVYTVACVHGSGGGMYPGATVNRNDMYLQALDGVDILISAHSHKPYALRGSKLVLNIENRRVTQRPTLSMCAGSWLAYGGYPIQKQLRPVAEPGANRLVLSGTRYRFEAVV
jgi:predicted phosphodiesterase